MSFGGVGDEFWWGIGEVGMRFGWVGGEFWGR